MNDQQTKDEIDVLFERRADDRSTNWPMVQDKELGHPWDTCVCGHSRQNHGFKGIADYGNGQCLCLDQLHDRPGTYETCKCRRFTLEFSGRESLVKTLKVVQL